MRVLLVEDNTELVGLLTKGLAQAGLAADSVGTVGDATHVLSTMHYAAIVLDLGLPDDDGLNLLRDLRRRGDATPVLVLTARDGVTDRVTGLREGADDYLPAVRQVEELGAPAGAVPPAGQSAGQTAHLRQCLARYRGPPGLCRRRCPHLSGT